IGLSVIANALKKHNIEIKVIDLVPFDAHEREKIFKSVIPVELAIYGFGVMIGNDHLKEVEKYVALIRKRSPKSVVVYGGHFPSSIPELMFEHCSCAIYHEKAHGKVSGHYFQRVIRLPCISLFPHYGSDARLPKKG
ncbi:unnamed protein product, partial [marine sediment metagenome]